MNTRKGVAAALFDTCQTDLKSAPKGYVETSLERAQTRLADTLFTCRRLSAEILVVEAPCLYSDIPDGTHARRVREWGMLASQIG